MPKRGGMKMGVTIPFPKNVSVKKPERKLPVRTNRFAQMSEQAWKDTAKTIRTREPGLNGITARDLYGED